MKIIKFLLKTINVVVIIPLLLLIPIFIFAQWAMNSQSEIMEYNIIDYYLKNSPVPLSDKERDLEIRLKKLKAL